MVQLANYKKASIDRYLYIRYRQSVTVPNGYPVKIYTCAHTHCVCCGSDVMVKLANYKKASIDRSLYIYIRARAHTHCCC